MFDAAFRPTVNSFMDKWAGRVRQSGLSANALTLIGFFFGFCGCFAAAMQVYPLAILLLLLNRFLDGMAGAVARQAGITALGSYLDMLCDFMIYAAFVFFFSMGQLEGVFAATLLLFAFLAMFCAYLLQSVFVARESVLETPRGGIVENIEMILYMMICCILPSLFAPISFVFALLCFVTAALRIMITVKTLKAAV